MLVQNLLVALFVCLSSLYDAEGFQLSSQFVSHVKPVLRSKYSSFSSTSFKRPSTQLNFQPTLEFSASNYDYLSSSSLLSTVSPAAAAVPVDLKAENSKAQPFDHVKREIQAIEDVLNYRVAMKKAMENGLPAPVLALDTNFLMYEDMTSEQLKRTLEQLLEKENLLLRGIFS
jgi:hypothetical protein